MPERVLALDLLRHIVQGLDDGHVDPDWVRIIPRILKAIDDAETRLYELPNPTPADLSALVIKAVSEELRDFPAFRDRILARLAGTEPN
jgi:hypothetical protein